MSARIRTALLELQSAIQHVLAELPSDAEASAPKRKYMKVREFAEARGFSERTIRHWCSLGMPHEGEGHARRVLVEEAGIWIAQMKMRKGAA